MAAAVLRWRLEQEEKLAAAAGADELLLVYLWPRPRPWCNTTGIGEQRERFLSESLAELVSALEPLGQTIRIDRYLVLTDHAADGRGDLDHRTHDRPRPRCPHLRPGNR